MKKRLPFFGLLLGLLLGSSNLMAADFTIEGKVSIVQESVPLPFYEVSIADGTGKYIVSVTTSFTGKYSHTFDIPAEEAVQFEVSVIDRCTGEALIEAIEKEGEKITIDFLVCDPDIITGEEETEEEEEGEEEENPDGNEEEEDGDYGGLPDFLNCEALGLDLPVCVVEADGNTTEYSNACIALDAGIELSQLTFCDGLPIGDGGLGIGGGFNCDQLGFDIPINVCVTNETGEALNLPLCDALNEGYPISQIEFCDGLGGLDGLDSLDCEGLGINLPVCTTDADGNEVNFDNPCDALSAGFELNQLNLCDDILSGGGLDGIDCEDLATDIPFTICVTNEAGETQEIELCEALADGLSFDELVLCDGGMGLLDSLDCEGLGINLPICGTDGAGNEITFNSPCEALDAGFELNQLSICNDILEDGIEGILGDLDCESLGLSVDIPVCTTNEAGEQVELMLCDALTQGISLENVDLCDGALDDIDCAGLGINLPVCSVDADGNEVTFDNPCDALAAGIALNELTFCEGLIDSVLENVDCTTFDFELPIPVCITNELGEQIELDLCDALSQGIAVDNIEICASTITGIGSDDCEALGLDIPVCAIDADGNKVEYANPCDALAAGLNIEDLTFCDNLLEDVMEAAFNNTTSTEEEAIEIEQATLFPNPASSSLILSLEFTENTEYEVNVQSINGNAIYRQKYNALNGANMTDMDVSSLSAGIYLLQVVTPRGIKTMKFIKQ